MRICVDVSPAVHRRAGVGRYTQELMAALLAIDSENEYVTFYNRPSEAQVDPPLDRLPHLTTNLPNKLWRMSVLLAQFAHISQDRLFPGVDLFHAADHLLPRLSRVRSIFTLYDLTFRFYPETHMPLNRWFLTLMMLHFLQATDLIIAISECTKRDAVRLYGIDEAKIRVIYGGVNPRFQPVSDQEQLEAIRRRYALPARFLLYVGTIEPRKNLSVLLEAFRQAHLRDVKLVIVGKRGWLYSETFARLQRLGLEQDVILTGFVPDNDLPGLYTLAEAFVFPSLYEGFGLPVLEAMACGTPVACSNASSLLEVVGDAALLFDPADNDAIATTLRRILNDANLQAALRERGLRRAAQFSWARTARDTLAVYEQVMRR